MNTKRVLTFSLFILSFITTISVHAQEAYLGEIRMFAGTFAPRGWAFCYGQLLPIAQNSALFAILGTVYGGDGKTTFALPNLQGRVAVQPGNGPGISPRILGESWGAENVTLSTQNMPSHTHSADVTATTTANINVSNEPGTTSDPSNGFLANTGTADREYRTVANATMNSGVVSATTTVNATVQPVGANTPFAVSPPSLGINFIICLEGLFPSRD